MWALGAAPLIVAVDVANMTNVRVMVHPDAARTAASLTHHAPCTRPSGRHFSILRSRPCIKIRWGIPESGSQRITAACSIARPRRKPRRLRTRLVSIRPGKRLRVPSRLCVRGLADTKALHRSQPDLGEGAQGRARSSSSSGGAVQLRRHRTCCTPGPLDSVRLGRAGPDGDDGRDAARPVGPGALIGVWC